MKFLYKKRKQEDLQKMTSFQEQLENINGLVDPLERALMLEKLRDNADNARCSISGRIHDNCVLLGLGGGFVFVAGFMTLSVPVMMLGATMTMGNILFGDQFQKPEEKTYKAFLGQIDSTIKTITKETSLEALAASPQLGTAMRHFPVLKERFEDAANTERYQKILLPQHPSQPQLPPPAPKRNDEGFRF